MSMVDALGRLMILFPLWPLISIAAAVLFYLRHRQRRTVDQRMPPALYAVIVLGSGAVAAFGGVLAGVDLACSRPAPGNLCGLVGVLVTGPIAGTLAIVLVGFAVSRAR